MDDTSKQQGVNDAADAQGADDRAEGWPVDGAGEGQSEQDALIEQLTCERDAANDKYLRALAEYQNYQRRSIQNEIEARRQGTTAVLKSILPVMDHFDLALTKITPDAKAEAILEGVRAIRAELVKALGQHGIAIIHPAPNDEFDPNRHQAVMHQPAGDSGVEPGRILTTLQAGYALEDRVIRAAMVSVAKEG